MDIVLKSKPKADREAASVIEAMTATCTAL